MPPSPHGVIEWCPASFLARCSIRAKAGIGNEPPRRQESFAMIAAVDVCYGSTDAVAACILFHAFTDEAPVDVLLSTIERVEPYEPGAFYRRELPCLLAVLALVKVPLAAVVIDGYVWLSRDRNPGLGARLHDAL